MHKQHGFGVVEAFLVLVIVGILVGITAFMLHGKQQIDARAAQTKAIAAATLKPAKVSTSVTPPATVTSYMVIKEWGVRLKLDAKTATLNYDIKADNPQYAYLGLKTISDIAPMCAADKFSLAVIGRYTKAQHDDAVANPTDNGGGANDIKVGDYYYGYDHSHAACADSDAEQTKIDALFSFNDLETAYKTISLVPQD